MAKKVIREGQKKFKTTCQECGTFFSYELEDVRGHGGARSVDCPVCGLVVHAPDVGPSPPAV
jgi:uncharacterized Zn finger protein